MKGVQRDGFSHAPADGRPKLPRGLAQISDASLPSPCHFASQPSLLHSKRNNRQPMTAIVASKLEVTSWFSKWRERKTSPLARSEGVVTCFWYTEAC